MTAEEHLQAGKALLLGVGNIPGAHMWIYLAPDCPADVVAACMDDPRLTGCLSPYLDSSQWLLFPVPISDPPSPE